MTAEQMADAIFAEFRVEKHTQSFPSKFRFIRCGKARTITSVRLCNRWKVIDLLDCLGVCFPTCSAKDWIAVTDMIRERAVRVDAEGTNAT